MQSTDHFQVGALEEKGRNILIKLEIEPNKHTQRKSENKLKNKKKGLDKMFCNEIQGQDT